MNNKLEIILESFDAIIITKAENVRYLSGFTGEGALLITPRRRVLFTDSRYIEAAESETIDFEIKNFGSAGLIAATVLEAQTLGARRVGFEDLDISHKDFLKLESGNFELIGISEDLAKIREIKEESEILAIRRAQKIAEDALKLTLEKIREGNSERKIASYLDFCMRELGSERSSFETIVVSGRNSSLPHGAPSDKLLERGDFVVIDFGAVYSGYHSDMTRTFVIGRASDRRREIYEAVLRAQTAALSIIKDGEKISEADKAAREILKEAELDKYFTHSLGHGVGLEIHERPNVGSRSSEIFRAGMVATVEPGVYIPGFGGVRIEDMCAVKFGGIDNLTNFPKELMEL